MKTKPIARSYPTTAIVTGQGSGVPLLMSEPLSFWGGYDASQGRVLEAKHPQFGLGLAGHVMLMERSKGSSSSSSVLAEAIRNGTGPAAIIMRERDLIIGLGCIVASELYQTHVPVAIVSVEVWTSLSELILTHLGSLAIDAPQCGHTLLHWTP
jgi:predicted aconitase with swiveling domain